MKKLGVLAVLVSWALTGTAGPQAPARQPGLWEVTLIAEPSPITVRQCTDKASEEMVLLSIVPGQENCGAATVSRQKNRYEIRNSCAMHGQRVNTRMELSGDLRTRYEGQYAVKFAGNAQSKSRSETRRFEGRWLGECPPGMRPGDMVLPNGMAVNVVDERKRAESAGSDGHGHEGHRH